MKSGMADSYQSVDDENEGFYCHSCGKYHDDLPMDVGFDYPFYKQKQEGPDTPNSDFYVIDTDYFIRGCLEIPVVDGPGPFVWGVWTSLSEKNFERARAIWRDDEDQNNEPPYFGWFA